MMESIAFNKLDILAFPMTFAVFENIFYSQSISWTEDFKLTRFLGFHKQGHLLSRIEPGKWPRFKFFDAYELNVWMMILVSFVAVSLLLMTHTRSIMESIWINMTLILGKGHFRGHINIRLFILFFFWLLSTLILISGLNGLFLRFFVKPIPTVVIDSWTDLFNRKELSIIGLPISYMTNYIDTYIDTEEMARDFHSRYEIFYPDKVNRMYFRVRCEQRFARGSDQNPQKN